MIDLKSFVVSDTFFGARNSHDGFKSMFGEIFLPTRYEKLFILKGGPGTGKSTLLRGFVSFANEVGIDAAAVLCSSDTSSLDGVILEKSGKKIAIIDGTSPHTVDPVFPGAIDEIINLGDGFDNGALERTRDEILEHSRAKARGYTEGYRTLSAAKSIFNYIWYGIYNSRFYNEAEIISKSVLRSIETDDNGAKFTNGIYSAFGKSGQYFLPVTDGNSVVNLSGEPILCSMIIDAIKRRCDEIGIRSRLYPDALDDRMADRLYIGNTVIAHNRNSEHSLELGDYAIADYSPDFLSLKRQYTSLLDIARKHFAAAADSHFSLEKIYSRAIDFSRNERIFYQLCQRIGDILL